MNITLYKQLKRSRRWPFFNANGHLARNTKYLERIHIQKDFTERQKEKEARKITLKKSC